MLLASFANSFELIAFSIYVKILSLADCLNLYLDKTIYTLINKFKSKKFCELSFLVFSNSSNACLKEILLIKHVKLLYISLEGPV